MIVYLNLDTVLSMTICRKPSILCFLRLQCKKIGCGYSSISYKNGRFISLNHCIACEYVFGVKTVQKSLSLQRYDNISTAFSNLFLHCDDYEIIAIGRSITLTVIAFLS